jgi:hypothetical protein
MRWLALAALAALPSDSPPGRLSGDRVTEWLVDHPDFGGFSAIELSKDGKGFLALTDQGVIFAGQLDRLADGHIAAIIARPPVYLADETGQRLDKGRNDTEGLALRDDGSFAVSLEGPAEIFDYAKLGGWAVALPKLPEWQALGQNAGLEALAVDGSGLVVTLPEQSLDRTYLVHEYRPLRGYRTYSIAAGDGFRPVAADFGQDGQFFVLERRVSLPGGFSSRLRRMDSGAHEARTIWQSKPGAFGNLEGMSIWRDPVHGLTATMISDDNFLSLLQTQLLEIVIGD